MSRFAVAVILAIIGVSCAAHSRGRSPQAGYDRLESEACGGERSEDSQVTVVLRDVTDAPVPGIHVHLLQADARADEKPSTTMAVTDFNGTTVLRVRGGYYALVVGAIGFVPEIRLLPLTGGCTGIIAIVLRVLDVEGLSVMSGNEARHNNG